MRGFHRERHALLFLAICLLTGNASAAEDCVPIGEVLLPASNKLITVHDLIEANKDNKIVLLGEHHDNMEHHRWQLQMIIALHTLNPDLVLGFEMFPRRTQPVLDRWVRGELTEEQFLKQVNWDEYWSFDPQLYMPLFHYARMNNIPMYALNVDRSLIHQVGKLGWKNTPEAEKEGISTPLPPSDGYRQILATVFMQHGEDHEGTPEELAAKAMKMPGFPRFVESQQVWDRAMAEGIANGIKHHPKAQFIAVMGSGHMMYHFGVPEQLADLHAAKPAVLIPWDPEFDCSYIQKDFADAVIGLKSIRAADKSDEDRPRLGIYLDHSDKGVIIAKVIPDSIAAGLGLQKNDVIVQMAGVTINEISQVIDIVKATQFGTWLPMRIKRQNETMDMVAKFPPRETKQNMERN
jgi:uncharacterized iron-regulated protein